MGVANVGSSPLMARSAAAQCLLMVLSTCKPLVESNPSVFAILKGTVRTFLMEECVWGSTWETAQVTAMRTLTLAGTPCPGL